MSPILILSLLVEDDNYDINASPDKREIFLKNEAEVMSALKVHLYDFFEEIQRVKAYEAPVERKSNMDLLESFKRSSICQAAVEVPKFEDGDWTSKKRSIEKITNVETRVATAEDVTPPKVTIFSPTSKKPSDITS